jgi:cyclomaltodextrinase / maltogenic alpha-amylase / neopullulanase
VGVMGGIDPDSRRAFPWDMSRWNAELLESMRGSFALRHREPALRSDGVAVLGTADAGIAFQRRADDRVLSVALNAGDAPVTLPLAPEQAPHVATILLGVGRARSEAPLLSDGEGAPSIVLPPRSGVVVSLA